MESSMAVAEVALNYSASVKELSRRMAAKHIASKVHVLEPATSRSILSRGKQKPGKDDFELIERLQNGDENALETLFNAYSAKLYNVAFKILGGDVADTQEVIQDVFWTAYRKAKSFRGTAHISTWLYRLTVNAALGRIRRSKKNREVEYEEFLPQFQEDGHHAVRPVVDWSNDLEENCAQREIQEFLKQALELLSPLDRSIVVLSDLEGLSDKEIAAAVAISVPAVKTRLHRARLFLRGKLAVRLGHSAA
jgi:RNA polymerase sigma-70 factor (ECF subfamily)